ncbi:NAD(P)H-dependent oxidoreductase [Streptomyces sp. Ncost-T10-10d]|uniref:NAD(P)H-dependent oxidoreductase n=1 Tax=Streptomyces sp. Ncost-T10-10d TaxID=1839774 RepID=UPI00081F07D8|nr:NAD(P)H-dependent oxidoreductase [Streptomyces sp. Ncost-T10-10d]SCF61838.1 NADPH-dependent FMN reductase [Streptomyces sp. Ncost-T10-10d]
MLTQSLVHESETTVNGLHMLGLSADEGSDPFGALLLRALASPGPTGINIQAWQVPDAAPPNAHTAPQPCELPPNVARLRAAAATADALLIAAPESFLPEPLLAALNSLGWPAATSPLRGLPTAVLTTSAGTESSSRFTSVEELLLSADCDLIGPRTVVPQAGQALCLQPDGRVLITDPRVTMRALIHLHRTAARAEGRRRSVR